MNRTLPVTLALAALLALPAAAQEAEAPASGEADIPAFDSELVAPSADSDNPAPLPGDPAISLAMPADPNDLLTGLYVTRAVAELCGMVVDPGIEQAMAQDEARFLTALSLDAAAGEGSYAQVRTAIETRGVDCELDGPDVRGAGEVFAVYGSQLTGTE